MRSMLFVPADSEKKLAKALASGADCLFLDLEDSVVPAAKSKARAMAREFILETKQSSQRAKLYVRVNALSSDFIDADLEAVMTAAPDGIVLPKCVNGAALQHLGAKLAVAEAEHDLCAGAMRIIAIATETAASIFNMGSYSGASERLSGLTWGAEDLAACLGADANRDGGGAYTAPYALARSLTLFAASAADALAIDEVLAIDTVYLNFRDISGFKLECEAARRDGFDGKMAIHPDQVAIINEVFKPSPQTIARAKAIVAAFAQQPQSGVISIDGEMLDRPHLVRARRLLSRREG
jgi:citrate lyase subunit beta/citryl-CoA lyase